MPATAKSGRLVGREAALAVTGAALAEAADGLGSLLLVHGEPGIGKSALLGEQARRAATAGVRVVRGIAAEGAGPPFWVWTQVVRGIVGRAAGEAITAGRTADAIAAGRAQGTGGDTVVLGDAARLLRPLWEGTSRPEESRPDKIGPDKIGTAEIGTDEIRPDALFRLFDAVATVLAEVARAGPLLVVLDDLQWADEPSISLLDHLRRVLAAEPVLLLGAYREGDAGPALRRLAAAVPSLPLAGLDTAGVSALMAAIAGPMPDPALADAVRRRCGGNPFFVRELTRLMAARGEPNGDGLPLPAGVRDALRMRLARLSPACAELLELAAVAGAELDTRLLAVVLGGSVPVADLVEEAEEARVLVTGGAGSSPPRTGAARFAHDLYRETVLAQIPATRRAELHAAVADALHVLSGGGADLAAVGGAARPAAHYVAAGPGFAAAALRYSVLAAREATSRLGHDDAARHYRTALRLLADVERAAVEERAAEHEGAGRGGAEEEGAGRRGAASTEGGAGSGPAQAAASSARRADVGDLGRDRGGLSRTGLLLELGAAAGRAGDSAAAREAYLRAAELARRSTDPAGLAGAALGLTGLTVRAGSDDPSAGLLAEAAAMLADDGVHTGPPEPGPATTGPDRRALRSRVLAALARALRHGSAFDETGGDERGAGPLPATTARRAYAAAAEAVELARSAGDAAALGHALLAQHDVVWRPGAAAARLPILAETAAAAERAGDADLAAEALLLRAGALIEQGDPAGVEELARYTRAADALGHARGRWGALSRRATLAQIEGRVAEAVAAADAARELGERIGLPDTMGCFSTLRHSLLAIGGPMPAVEGELPENDPLWPWFPLLMAWRAVQAGEPAEAAAVIRGFPLPAVPEKYDLEFVAITSIVAAAVGTDGQREALHRRWAPFAGLHLLIGGCVAYHGVVDHQLGLLAAALGRTEEAAAHFTAAVALTERLGAPAWAQLSREALAVLPGAAGHDVLRRVDDGWHVRFDGRAARLPDVKGLQDIATLIASPGQAVPALTLAGHVGPAAGADPVLDRRAVAAYRARLAELDTEIDDAEAAADLHRAGRARAEREALLAGLSAATGLGGRPRTLGDEAERARKAVTARIRDALRRIEPRHPELAAHLRSALRTGTSCCYSPDPPRRWER